jgi:uncharacterized membrane protein
MVNRKDAKHVNGNRWVWLSLISFFSWGMLSLSSKYLFNHGLSTIAFLLWLYVIVTACIIFIDKIRLSELRSMHSRSTQLLLLTGVFSTLFNFGQFQAIHVAPNVGYVNAINAASIALVTVMAVLLFKDELTKRKALGVVGVTTGLILLLI